MTEIRRICMLAITLAILPFAVFAQMNDVWHHHQPGDELYVSSGETVAFTSSSGDQVILHQRHSDNAIIGQIAVRDEPLAGQFQMVLTTHGGSEYARTYYFSKNDYSRETDGNFTFYTFRVENDLFSKISQTRFWRFDLGGTSYEYDFIDIGEAFASVGWAWDAPNEDDEPEGESLQYEAWFQCNVLASHPDDENAAAQGVDWDDLQAEAAITACKYALDFDNEVGQIHYLLGRAYDKAGDVRARRHLLYAATGLDYPMAYSHLGMLYETGEYADKNLPKARRLYKAGYALENLSSGYSYARLLKDEAKTNNTAKAELARVLKDLTRRGYDPARVWFDKLLADNYFEGVYVPD